ncbi:MAG: hypothetical protein K6F71_08450 [Ruminococcus sp.]|uniref:hypothetical protein n=1 Tax=Ruminococcus sp. TaxID=41978 RepID=UPI0025D1FEB6|nr:hypothetical protein [Ruminococcus sp.]MCR5540830.1 hypothetical protein [Ruminococcus sp.]
MLIYFSMNDINDMNYLYTFSSIQSYSTISRTSEYYNGTDYCKSVLNDIRSTLSNCIEYKYEGTLERLGNEVFIIKFATGREYRVSFEINTFNMNYAQMKCTINTNDADTYDNDLEFLKVSLKDRLLRDWKKCTWLVDEQAALLCKEAYLKAFIVESKLREFASKVLIHHLGINWIKKFGFEKYNCSVERLKVSFIKQVPEFNNIDTDFLSMTLETLLEVMTKGIILKDNEVSLNREDYNKIYDKATKKDSGKSIQSYLKEKWKIEKHIWDDLFTQYIDDLKAFLDCTNQFISGRNHIAHSKILSWCSYKIIDKDFDDFKGLLDKAIIKFDESEASKEILDTRDAVEEMEREKEYEKNLERNYFRNRLANETGIDILNYDEIKVWFDEIIGRLYHNLYSKYKLDPCYEISELTLNHDDTPCFSILSPVEDDGSSCIYIKVKYNICDDIGEDSYCEIQCIDSTNKVINHCNIRFHNGNGIENDEGLMEPTEDAEYDDSELEEFIDDIPKYVYLLNPYPQILSALSYMNKGAVEFVADFPCEQCGKIGVSINEELLPIGKCCYCGFENEIVKCNRCGSIVSSYLAENGFCPSCSAYIDKQ